MKKRTFVLTLCLLTVLLVPLWRGIAKYQDVKMEYKDLQEPTDMNIVLEKTIKYLHNSKTRCIFAE